MASKGSPVAVHPFGVSPHTRYLGEQALDLIAGGLAALAATVAGLSRSRHVPGDNECMERHPHVPPDVAASPWVGMATEAAREWWRDHPGAPLHEYDTWAYREYEPMALRGMGVPAGWRRLTATQRAALDAIHVGLTEGAALRRQRAA